MQSKFIMGEFSPKTGKLEKHPVRNPGLQSTPTEANAGINRY